MFRNLTIHHVLAPAFLLAFAVLLTARAGFFTPENAGAPKEFALENVPLGNEGLTTWMNILKNGKKMGYAQRRIVRSPEGYSTQETVFMSMNTLGVVQDIHYRSSAKLGPDLRLESFSFNLGSPLASMALKGAVRGKTLRLEIGEGPNQKHAEIPLAEPPYWGTGLMYTAAVVKMKPGESATFPVFDPVTTSQKDARATLAAIETIRVMGKEVSARRVEILFAGNSQTSWVDGEGEVLAEESPLGIRMEKVTRELALKRDTSAGDMDDIIEAAAIAPDKPLEEPETLDRLVVRFSGAGLPDRDLSGDRQTYADGILTVRKERLPDENSQAPLLSAADAVFLSPSAFVASDDPTITAQAKAIVSLEDSPLERARKITAWVHTSLEKRPVVSVPDALTTLSSKTGDCNEHAVLTAALARAAGVPARIEIGLCYLKGRFYYHAWNALWIQGSWITADTVFGQFPADVAHLRLARGNPQAQVEMLAYLGKLEISVLEQTK